MIPQFFYVTSFSWMLLESFLYPQCSKISRYVCFADGSFLVSFLGSQYLCLSFSLFSFSGLFIFRMLSSQIDPLILFLKIFLVFLFILLVLGAFLKYIFELFYRILYFYHVICNFQELLVLSLLLFFVTIHLALVLDANLLLSADINYSF